MLYFVYVAFVASRRPFGVTRRALEEDQHLSAWQLGMIDTGFLAMYTLGQIFYGTIKAHLRPRSAITLGLSVSAVSLLLFSRSSGFYPLFILWSLNGLANSPGWPTCMRILTPWIHPAERGWVMGVWASCQAAGGVVGNAAASFTLGRMGWRNAVAQAAGLVGVVAFVAWQQIIEHPSHAGFCEAGSDAVDAENDVPETKDKNSDKGEPFGALSALRVPGVIPVVASHFCEKMIRYTLLFWLPYYLTTRLHYDAVASGYAASAFDIGGVAGSIVSGGVADRYANGSRRVSVCVLFLFAAGLALLPFALCPTLLMSSLMLPILGCFFIGFFLLGFDSLLTGAVIQDIAQKGGVAAHVSAISGVIGGSGSFGSILQGPITAGTIRHLSWEWLWFTLFALVLVASASLVPSACKVCG